MRCYTNYHAQQQHLVDLTKTKTIINWNLNHTVKVRRRFGGEWGRETSTAHHSGVSRPTTDRRVRSTTSTCTQSCTVATGKQRSRPSAAAARQFSHQRRPGLPSNIRPSSSRGRCALLNCPPTDTLFTDGKSKQLLHAANNLSTCRSSHFSKYWWPFCARTHARRLCDVFVSVLLGKGIATKVIALMMN